MKFIQYLRPAMSVLPEVEKPARMVRLFFCQLTFLKQPIKTRLIWTGITLLIFLICSQVPLYGVQSASGSDPFYWMRHILASNRGTLMELGIHPYVTAGMVMQLLAGAKILEIDQNNKEDKALFAAS